MLIKELFKVKNNLKFLIIAKAFITAIKPKEIAIITASQIKFKVS